MSTPHHRAYLVTPHGTGAIAVIRLVGPDPEAVIRSAWVPSSRTTPGEDRLCYGRLMDGEETLDDVLLSMESVSDHERAVEISCHGGVHIVQRILRLLENRGASIATGNLEGLQVWPADNKIEAEAIEALAKVKTQRAARYAAFLRHALPRAIKEHLLNHAKDRQNATKCLTELLAGFGAAQALLEGVTVCLIGPPNSGKSTLFNRLLGRQAVVTSPMAGTTRDWVSQTVEFEGLPVEMVDTAGRRETQCDLEKQAIEAGNFPLTRSDLTLLVLDQSLPFRQEAVDWVGLAPRFWVVGNKSDLAKCWAQDDLVRLEQTVGTSVKFVSARTGEGCELLKHAIVKHFGLFDSTSPTLAFFTDRQRALATQALAESKGAGDLFRRLLEFDLAETDRKGL